MSGKTNVKPAKKEKTKLASQIMAPLPSLRLYVSRSGHLTKLLWTGPYMTVQGRGQRQQKKWLCFFTCLATRAVHLEVPCFLKQMPFLTPSHTLSVVEVYQKK